MRHLFVLIEKATGKTVAEMTNRKACEREAEWHGGKRLFVIRQALREPSWGFGVGRPNRYVGPWPEAKVEEFRKRYVSGEPVERVADYFDTSVASVTSMARKLHIPRRVPRR
jgi:hypothetical protein